MNAILPLLLLLLILVVVSVVVGGAILKRMLPKYHPAQKYLSDDAIETALAWIFRNFRKMAAWALILTFSILTLVYS
jgi:hypothetical protein